jgi:hypothetical protein
MTRDWQPGDAGGHGLGAPDPQTLTHANYLDITHCG